SSFAEFPDFDLERTFEDDFLAPRDERVDVRVQLAQIGNGHRHHEWGKPLGLAVCDGDLQQTAGVARVVDDVARGQTSSRVFDLVLFTDQLVVALGAPGVTRPPRLDGAVGDG